MAVSSSGGIRPAVTVPGEGGKALVALLQGVADENGYENLSPKAKLPSYSNLFGMA